MSVARNIPAGVWRKLLIAEDRPEHMHGRQVHRLHLPHAVLCFLHGLDGQCTMVSISVPCSAVEQVGEGQPACNLFLRNFMLQEGVLSRIHVEALDLQRASTGLCSVGERT